MQIARLPHLSELPFQLLTNRQGAPFQVLYTPLSARIGGSRFSFCTRLPLFR